jgi:hypothetical protein
LAKKSGIITTEELKVLMYSAKTDDDIKLVLKGISTYRFSSPEFRFASPLMRVLYVLDKPDKALELFTSEV